MDIVERIRIYEIDHVPEGWPAIKMKQVSELADEIERLRAESDQLMAQELVGWLVLRDNDKTFPRFFTCEMNADELVSSVTLPPMAVKTLAYSAAQKSPVAISKAEKTQSPAVAAPVSRDVIREVFMRNGFTVKEWQSDLKDYVFNAAYDLLSLSPRITEQDAREIATQFFYWWHNQPGTNTNQGFDDWIGGEGRDILKKINNNPTTTQEKNNEHLV